MRNLDVVLDDGTTRAYSFPYELIVAHDHPHPTSQSILNRVESKGSRDGILQRFRIRLGRGVVGGNICSFWKGMWIKDRAESRLTQKPWNASVLILG